MRNPDFGLVLKTLPKQVKDSCSCYFREYVIFILFAPKSSNIVVCTIDEHTGLRIAEPVYP